MPNGNRTLLPRPQPAAVFRGDGRALRDAPRTRRARCAISTRSSASTTSGWTARTRSRRARAWRRVVRLPNGALLNRYWDDIPEPRPESYREDYALAQTVPAGEARGALPEPARGGRERVGFLEPLDARPEGSAHARDDRPRAGGSQQPALSTPSGRSRRCVAFARATGDARSPTRYDSLATRAPRSAARGGVRFGERMLLRRALAHRRSACATGRRSPPRRRSTSASRRRSRGARWPRGSSATSSTPGGFVTTLIVVGPAVGRAERMAAARVARDRGRAPLRARRRRRHGARALARAQSPRVPRDGEDDGEVRRAGSRRAPPGGGEYPTQDGFGWTNGVALALSARRLEPHRLRTRLMCAPTQESAAAVERDGPTRSGQSMRLS